MTLDFYAYPHVDEASQKRTEEFFTLIENNAATDAKLLHLVNQGIYPEARDRRGYTALIRVAMKGYTETAKALLATDADIDAKTPLMPNDLGGNTALMYAVMNGHHTMVRTLLAAGANIEKKNYNNDTALTLAAKQGVTDAVRVLLEAGANLNTQNKQGKTATKTAANEDLFLAFLNLPARHAFYDAFIENGTAPQSAVELYRLLAMTPLAASQTEVDYTSNIRKIFAHAQWPDKEQAADILTQMKYDGRINAETADSILSNSFPEPLHAQYLQRHANGMAR